MFNNLGSTRNEKIDLLKMALRNYSSPYKVEGSDAATLNNLSDFVSNNIIFKERKDYTDNELSNALYKYTYRYFTQFVNPVATIDIMEMLILYNKYMVFNIGDNSLNNIFNIKETFTYRVNLIDDATLNVNQNVNNIYEFSIPYAKNTYRSNYSKKFKVSKALINGGKLTGISSNADGFLLSTNNELDIANEYDLISSNVKIAKVSLELVNTSDNKSRQYKTGTYIKNITNNIINDFTKFIDNMYISDEVETSLTDETIINDNIDKDAALYNKQVQLRTTLEELKANDIIKRVIISKIVEFAQDDNYEYTTTYGESINISKLAKDAIKQIHEEIKYTGIELDELHIIFQNSVNSYNSSDFSNVDVSTLEAFINELFWWKENVTTEINADTSKYFFISNSDEGTDDSVDLVTYKTSINDAISKQLSIYLYKYFILMDIRTLNLSLSVEKDKAINPYEISQISDNKPINYINVIHRIDSSIDIKLNSIIDILKINNNGVALDTTGDKMISFTFQYKELNKDIYDLFMQDQVETYIANWLTSTGSISSLFNSIYINNFNESAWALASDTNIDSYFLNDVKVPTYFKKTKSLVANTINFREKGYMDIVGYHLDTYKDVYYGINSEHKQEIGLFLRSFQDVRDYYFKNLLLKSLVNDDTYAMYEFILLVTMAFDRYFNQKVAKHKHLDSYSSEEIENFLNSFGLSELNLYDNFYGSFDYKMAVIRNYNNLIKNKGTRRVKGLIESMLNDSNSEYEVDINEYYITKSTQDSISLVKQLYYDGVIYDWDEEDKSWSSTNINTEDGEVPIVYYDDSKLYIFVNGEWVEEDEVPASMPAEPEDGSIWYWYETNGSILHTYDYIEEVWVDEVIPTTKPEIYTYIDEDGVSHETVGYTWYDEGINSKITYVYDINNEVITTVEVINTVDRVPSDTTDTPELLGLIEYRPEKDKTLFVSIPEGTQRPITTIKNKVDSNTVINYRDFIANDEYWNKDITEAFINGSNDLNLNMSKTKYLSISASINMETVNIMNMYIISILDNLLDTMKYDLTLESYTDDYISLSKITYTDLIKYIKFMNSHIGDLLDPYKVSSADYNDTKFYGVPKISDMSSKLTKFETELKKIISGISGDEIDEFLKDKISTATDGDKKEIISINRYAYETDIDNLKAVSGSSAFVTSRHDGSLTTKKENSFSTKLRKLLLGFGYSSVDYQNSATFILDLLESTNLISVMEVDSDNYSATKAKYLKLLNINSISSQKINLSNLYEVNLKSLLQMLMDYTQNKIFKEDYTLKDSSVTNTLAINNTFIRILTLVIETFFERSNSVYKDATMESFITNSYSDTDNLPEFMEDFIDTLKSENLSSTDRKEKLQYYNSVLNSMNTVLTFMTNSEEYELLKTVNTINKNFSDAEYLNFLISLLSFFMSYKVTIYEESHQLDLSNDRETFLFAEDLLVWSELYLEEDWFFDEEIIEIDTIIKEQDEEEE